MATTPTKRGPGRPPAKHSSEEYAQMSIYLHKTVRNAVKGELFKEAGEFSGLVESLLRGWLKERDVKISARAVSKTAHDV
jgi:hypothetical protein